MAAAAALPLLFVASSSVVAVAVAVVDADRWERRRRAVGRRFLVGEGVLGVAVVVVVVVGRGADVGRGVVVLVAREVGRVRVPGVGLQKINCLTKFCKIFAYESLKKFF